LGFGHSGSNSHVFRWDRTTIMAFVQPTGCLLGEAAANLPIPRSLNDLVGVRSEPGTNGASGRTSVLSLPDDRSSPSLKGYRFARDRVDVIHAEDQEIFLHAAGMGLGQQGILTENISVAEDGLAAMELLLEAQTSDEERPLLLLLDLRMPNMGGLECAKRAREMADRGLLKRPPFVVGYSSQIRQSCTDYDKKVFNEALARETLFPDENAPESRQLNKCLQSFQSWWEGGARRKISASSRCFDIKNVDTVIADTWEICRANIALMLHQLGVSSNRMHEADDAEEALEHLGSLMPCVAVPEDEELPMPEATMSRQRTPLSTTSSITGTSMSRQGTPSSAGAPPAPLLVFLTRHLGHVTGAQCAARARDIGRRANREPFLVCISVDEKSMEGDMEFFHCFLPKSFKKADLRWVLELFRLWWLERCWSVQAGVFEDNLCEAMQSWRARREKKKKKNAVLGSEHLRDSGENYGDQCRRLRESEHLSGEGISEVLANAWPNQCTCDDGTLLGSGSQAEVYLGEWRTESSDGNGKWLPAAVKVVHASAGDVQRFSRELAIGMSISHPNVVTVYAGSSRPPLVIIQEYCRGESLHKLLYSTSGAKMPTFTQRLKIALDVARGMAKLHDQEPQVVHRDLKSENVLLAEPIDGPTDVPIAKVADFGLARHTSAAASVADRYMTMRTGSLRWMAPEVMGTCNYGVQADVFSFGVLLYELITCSMPYADAASTLQQTLEQLVSDGGRPDAQRIGHDVAVKLAEAPRWLRSLMHRAWAHNPDDRPTFREIVTEVKKHLGELDPLMIAGEKTPRRISLGSSAPQSAAQHPYILPAYAEARTPTPPRTPTLKSRPTRPPSPPAERCKTCDF